MRVYLVSISIVRWKRVGRRGLTRTMGDQPRTNAAFALTNSLLSYKSHRPNSREIQKRSQRKRNHVADTSKIEDKLERKKLKRTARKKAGPKAKRTGPRGEKKKKVKKLARGVSKR
jgi:hypothetical protein